MAGVSGVIRGGQGEGAGGGERRGEKEGRPGGRVTHQLALLDHRAEDMLRAPDRAVEVVPAQLLMFGRRRRRKWVLALPGHSWGGTRGRGGGGSFGGHGERGGGGGGGGGGVGLVGEDWRTQRSEGRAQE